VSTNADLWREAVDLHQAGDLAGAVRCYRELLTQAPEHAGALHLLGTALAQQGDPAGGLGLIERALALDGRNPAIHSNLGNVLLALGRVGPAVAAYRQALALAPDHADALLNLGVALLRAGDGRGAVASLGQALARRPGHAPALCALAEALLATGALAAAEDHARRALARAPGRPEATLALANALRRQRRFEEAAAVVEAALAVHPGQPVLYSTLGQLRLVQGRFAQAVAGFRSLLAAGPREGGADHVQGLAGLGNAMAALGRLDEAAAFFRQARAFAPDDQGLRWNESLVTLTRGELAAGWAGFDARLNEREARARPETADRPPWRGEPISGRTLFLHAEQGLGDTLQFIRYAPLAHALGARVIAEVQPPLVCLLSGMAGIDRVIAQTAAPAAPATGSVSRKGVAPVPAFDHHCPLLSLPRAFGTTLATIPAPLAYLAAEPERAGRWRARLTASAVAPRKVGLIWAGNPEMWDDHLRSPGLAVLAPVLAVPGVHFFCLQLGPGRRDLAALPGSACFTDLGAEITDFADTAAIMDGLDLVISSCTAPAHLAGALGRPLWLMLAFAPDWRWFRDRTDSPWYPSARLFRQPRPGAWPEVAAAIARALEDLN